MEKTNLKESILKYTTGVQHIGIPTLNMDATETFYTALGFDPYYRTINDGGRVVFFRLHNLVIESYEQKVCAMKAGAVDHVAVDVNDVDAVYKVVCENGMNNMNDTIHFLPFFEHGFRFFKIEGPSREILEFGQIL